MCSKVIARHTFLFIPLTSECDHKVYSLPGVAAQSGARVYDQIMQEPTLQFPVTCPDCALESLSEIPIALIANALLTGKSVRLHASCHGQYWTATFIERQQLRKSLGAMTIETPRTAPHGRVPASIPGTNQGA
jgi:hypothetical protein